MTQNEKTTLTPKLRFPEFKRKSAWTIKKLGELFQQREETGYENIRLLSLTDKEGIIPQEESNRKNGASADRSKYLRVVPGDIVYNTMRMWEGRSALAHIEGIVSPAYTVCTPRAGTNGLFFSYYFKTPQLIAQFARYSQGLVKDTLNLKFEAFAQIHAAIPIPAEQQKIAECLSALDELIEAESRKLDTLKAHKKGLMQQLFPRAGETRPRLRFPEFREAPEWRLYTISDFAKVTTGSRDTQDKVDNGRYPFFVRSQTIERIDTYSYDGEAVLTSGDGVGVGKNYHYINGKFDFHQRVYCIYDFSDIVNGRFFYLYFSEHFRTRVMRMSAKNSVDSVRMPMITEMPVPLPSVGEQLCIADCLFSLEHQITAQSEKLEALRTHKRGLMQQLFPNPCEFES